MPSEKTLEKYRLVVDEWFVNGFNGTKAYQKYYPKAAPKTADRKFRDIIEVEEIVVYKKEKHKQAELVARSTHEGLLNELKNWAYSDITETILLTPEQIKDLPESIRRLISKFKHTTRSIRDKEGNIIETIENIELTFVSKEKAMEMINKHTGFYEMDNSQKTVQLAIPKVYLKVE